jgi:hypothetical protein
MGLTSLLIERTIPARLQPRNNVLLNISRMQWWAINANHHHVINSRKQQPVSSAGVIVWLNPLSQSAEDTGKTFNISTKLRNLLPICLSLLDLLNRANCNTISAASELLISNDLHNIAISASPNKALFSGSVGQLI